MVKNNAKKQGFLSSVYNFIRKLINCTVFNQLIKFTILKVSSILTKNMCFYVVQNYSFKSGSLSSNKLKTGFSVVYVCKGLKSQSLINKSEIQPVRPLENSQFNHELRAQIFPYSVNQLIKITISHIRDVSRLNFDCYVVFRIGKHHSFSKLRTNNLIHHNGLLSEF